MKILTVRPRASLLNPELVRPSALNSQPRGLEKIWLDKNENLDPELMALSRRVFESMPMGALATYPEAGELYRKLANWAGVSADSLLLTPGSDGVIRLVFEAFVEPGDSVIITEPTFAMYPVYAKMFGAQAMAVKYQPGTNGPVIDITRIGQLVRETKPKILCLPNPDSPTGTIASSDCLEDMLEACESVGSVLLVDEAYHPFHAETMINRTQTSKNLVVARTFAKAWGAAGMRIGYAVAHPETINYLHKLRPMYEVSTIATEFMSRMLDHAGEMQASVDRIIAGKGWFAKSMMELGFDALPTAGNFQHVNFHDFDPAVHEALASKVLYRKSFEEAALVGYSRFTMAPKAILEPVVDIIQRVVSG